MRNHDMTKSGVFRRQTPALLVGFLISEIGIGEQCHIVHSYTPFSKFLDLPLTVEGRSQCHICDGRRHQRPRRFPAFPDDATR